MCSTSADGALGALEAALDALAAVDLPVDDGARLDRVRRLVTASHRLSAEHDGLKSMRSWLRGHTLLPDAAAKRLIDGGRALEVLPATEAAFTAGRIGVEQVAAMAPITTPPRLAQAADLGVDVAGIETELVELAQRVSHRRLRAAVHYYTERLDPDGVEPDPTEGRSFTLSRLLGGR